ncbi:MAG TPA: DUF4846 domain-containing protein [Myxococcota bacterium]|nr:DUF4846 domain-containing protein [Myxococcota bacterium]
MCSCAASFLAAAVLAAPLWQTSQRGGDTLEQRFEPPKGFSRVAVAPESLGAFLRALPLLDGNPDVLLYDGGVKRYQRGHLAVVDIDVGKHDLQQCADAVMRLLAEYRYARKLPVCFTATSGDPMPWERYARGERPSVTGNHLSWSSRAAADADHDAFRGYLDTVFTWAGTLSLHRDLGAVADTGRIEPGDVFIVGGSPGHAVLVADVAENAKGEQRFLLVQSYMPAQQIHVLRGYEGPWFSLPEAGRDLPTPEWTFPSGSRRRYTRDPCR